jgi:hypothetical protein
MTIIRSCAACFVLMFPMLCLFSNGAHARTWIRENGGQAAAQDYLMITDQRPDGQFVLLMWLAPPMLSPNQADVRDVMSKYIVFMVMAGNMDEKTGIFTGSPAEAPVLLSKGVTELRRLPDEKIPPMVLAAITGGKAMFSQSMGSVGQSSNWYVFEPGDVDACKPGELSVKFKGELYNYRTPVPGCAVKAG